MSHFVVREALSVLVDAPCAECSPRIVSIGFFNSYCFSALLIGHDVWSIST
jgi:hypothetical protein